MIDYATSCIDKYQSILRVYDRGVDIHIQSTVQGIHSIAMRHVIPDEIEYSGHNIHTIDG